MKKKSKMEKKFSPLSPLLKPPQQLPINSTIASIMDEDVDLDSATGSIMSNTFNF
ncbi:hypothetical protein A2U01_0107971, partial [Trifolium medium]|nr:hypothetical protein [Trifolium medium]